MFRVIAVDDEKRALDRFERIAAADPRISVIGKFSEAAEAVEFVRRNQVDIAFLDIEMPGINGLELAETLCGESNRLVVVFVTAYDHYALRAFQAHAIGYLLKPLDGRELKEQVDRLERRTEHRKAVKKPERLQVRCFGQFICTGGELGEAFRWRTAKAEELFALLVQYQGRLVSKEILIDHLWPDSEPEKAANHFRVTCTYLRNALAEKGFHGILIRERDNYRIKSEILDCDLYRYLSFQRHPNTGENRCFILEEAVGLYSGPYLEGRQYEWAQATRTWLEGIYRRLLFHLAEEYSTQGNIAHACLALERILLNDPLEEEAVERLISLKIQTGEAAAAVRLYRNYDEKLMQELGTRPSAKLTRLLEQIEP